MSERYLLISYPKDFLVDIPINKISLGTSRLFTWQIVQADRIEVELPSGEIIILKNDKSRRNKLLIDKLKKYFKTNV